MIKIFDTLQQSNIDFDTTNFSTDNNNSSNKKLKWYSCGPTVYSSAHLGHARNYIINDLIRRSLESFFKVDVELCMNITDVDDKILNIVENQTLDSIKEFTSKLEAEFWSDMKALNVSLPTHIVRVSDSMDKIIDYIDTIIQNGYAYEEDGSVYFNTDAYEKTYPNQPKFSRTIDDESNNNKDFVLWKAGKGIWNSKWSIGRPGWHIECSAMASSILGAGFDLHTGGIDLMFPHHQNEILQTHACEHQQLCKHWLHVGHLHINGHKMSKSLKNFITIQDALKQYSSHAIRLCFMIHDWTKSLDFNDNTMTDVLNIDSSIQNYINWYPNTTQTDKFLSTYVHFDNIKEYLSSNFNFSAVILYIQNSIKQRNISPSDCERLLNMLGLDYKKSETCSTNQAIDILVNFRTSVRTILKDKKSETKIKDLFLLCDKLRDGKLKNLGINIDDL
jgi:cysteinyl-tRNA synthetase